MKTVQRIASFILVCPVVAFGQSFDHATFLEAFKNRIWNSAALVGGSRIACQYLRLGRSGASWTQEFANVPQLSAVLHGQKADLLLSLAAVAAEETGVPLFPPRAGIPQFHREGDPFVRPLVVMAGSDAASARPLPDSAFSAFATELLDAAFDGNAMCNISQIAWTPEPRTAAEWGKSLCLQMNRIVAAGRIEFAKNGPAQPGSSVPVSRFLPGASATCFDDELKPIPADSWMAEAMERSRKQAENRKKAHQEKLAEQQRESDLERQEEQKRVAEAQKARDVIVTRFLATDYAKRLTSSCFDRMEYRLAHSAETLLPSEETKAHAINGSFCGCVSRQLAVDPTKIDADQKATFEMIISAIKTHSKIPNTGVRDRFAHVEISCVTPDMVLSGIVSIQK